ncbi:UNVERIFIED_CONTAM: hypothetical protein Sradi_4554600 [Sesamum radiatum]|uniref:Endonuclease/exonuclease/phosphatase n=1 Tax=Sesamum radiatum TaxID=300843 RepID=A0AAW2NB82_SESRA
MELSGIKGSLDNLGSWIIRAFNPDLVFVAEINQFPRPWLCVKDFNEILGQSKKSGGPQHHAWQMRKFRSTLVDCGFSDLGCLGELFMWSNRHPYSNTILECLDRAYANGGWSQLFLSNKVSHILMSCSNHKAPIIHVKMTQKFSIGRGRLSRFEATWLQSEQYEVVAEANWNQLLISNSSHGLTGWRRKGNRGNKHRVENLKKRLSVILSRTLTQELQEEPSSIRKELESITTYEEKMWR